MPDGSLISTARSDLHQRLVERHALSIDRGVASIADSNQVFSTRISKELAQVIGFKHGKKLPGQTSGALFEDEITRFVNETFPRFDMLRPGDWDVRLIGNKSSHRGTAAVARYEPYTHLDELAAAIEQNPTLESVLGNAYAISPDVIVTRQPVADSLINLDDALVDENTGRLTAIRSANQARSILHAVISCKFTLRSDRAQNARSEALNLIRNRKGRLPHVVVVTAEPVPSRLSSLALGTGDLDCVYHLFLTELRDAIRKHGNDENVASLELMIDGKRLKDISDLPLDLTV